MPQRVFRPYVQSGLVLLALYSAILLCLWATGAFRAEFADYPDEAGHYVTGLLFHDYIAGFHYSSPIKFAENFYIHYPKVAIGHWPPVFYLMQAFWTLIFSVSHGSLMFFMALLTALLAFAIYKILFTEIGRPLSLAAALIFIALPLVQRQTGTLMADVPVALFMLLAVISFGRFVDSERPRDAILFSVWASVALLTKGNALALALVPVFAIAVTRKWQLFLRPALWYSAAIVLIVCTPWYWLTLHMLSNGLGARSGAFYFVPPLADFWRDIPRALGWPLAILALFGFAVKGTELLRSRAVRGIWPALGGLFFGCMLVFSFVPTGSGERYVLPALVALMAFLASGAARLALLLPAPRLRPVVITAALLLCFATAGFVFPAHSRGYAAVAQTILSSPKAHDSVILISSNSVGEGSFISEMAMRDHRPSHIILRGSKVLARMQWNGIDPKLVFHSPAEIFAYLDSIPVNLVILDDSQTPYNGLLQQAMNSASHWKLSASYPLWKNGSEDPVAVRVYTRTAPPLHPLGIIHINLDPMLGKSLTLKLPTS